MNNLGIMLRGIFMGFCDIIPGISGGTIAFITGIYPRLMNGIKAYTPSNLLQIFSSEEARKKLDLFFFSFLVFGLFIGVVGGALILPVFLANYPVFILSFFVGLILASAFIIASHVEKHLQWSHSSFFFIGLLLGVLIAVLLPLQLAHTYGIIFLSGFLTVCAMLLPGVSGAYLLLILGQYEFLLKALHTPIQSWNFIAVFLMGGVVSLFIVPRIITFFLKKWKGATLYLLSGLIVGSLIMPVRMIIETPFYWNNTSSLLVGGIFFIGLFVVILLHKHVAVSNA